MTAALIDAFAGLNGVTITVRHQLEPASQRLMDTLGVTVLIDPSAPRCERYRSWECGMGKRRSTCRRCDEIEAAT